MIMIMKTRGHPSRRLLFAGTSCLFLFLFLLQIPALDAFFVDNNNNDNNDYNEYDPRQSTEEFGTFCAAEKESYANCVFRMEPASTGKACDECRIATFDNLTVDNVYDTPDNCELLEDTLCRAVHSCGCGDCQDELEDFWRCTTEIATNETYTNTCSLECFTTPTTTTADGPLCPTEFDTYKNCVLEELEPNVGDACDTCRLSASSQIPNDATDCSVVQDIFCHAVRTCDCQHCSTPMHDYLDCDVQKRWFGECNVDCTNYDSKISNGEASAAQGDSEGGDGEAGSNINAQMAQGGDENSSSAAAASSQLFYGSLTTGCVSVMSTTIFVVVLVLIDNA